MLPRAVCLLPFLSLSCALQIQDSALQSLAHSQQLKSLNLSHTPITTEGLDALDLFPQLTSLSLERCGHIHGGVPRLAELPALQHLACAGSIGVSACAVLAALSNCPQLTFLDLSWCKGPQQPYQLAMQGCWGLNALQVLNLGCACVPHRALQCVSRMHRLRSLNLSAFALTSASPESLADNARDAPAAWAPQGGILSHIAALPDITRLELRWSRVCSKFLSFHLPAGTIPSQECTKFQYITLNCT
jgi:hypothetical protein